MKALIPIGTELRIKLWKVSILFIASILVGLAYSVLAREEALLLFQEVEKSMQGLENVGVVGLFLLIFFNNTIKTYLFMLAGVLFGFLPGLFVVSNGIMIGLFGGIFMSEGLIVPFVATIIPHGIFEIAAFLIASAYGFLLGTAFTDYLRNKTPLYPRVRAASKYFMQYLLPLFFIAAAIEVLLSPLVAGMYL